VHLSNLRLRAVVAIAFVVTLPAGRAWVSGDVGTASLLSRYAIALVLAWLGTGLLWWLHRTYSGPPHEPVALPVAAPTPRRRRDDARDDEPLSLHGSSTDR
jgi:hypothetical protein